MTAPAPPSVISETQQVEDIPSEEELDALFQKIKEDPNNLELNFEYAKMAEKAGKIDAAIASYERMLIVNPDLPRVKLDLGLVYMRMGNMTEARRLFSEVLESNPPPQVKENIELVLAKVDESEYLGRQRGGRH